MDQKKIEERTYQKEQRMVVSPTTDTVHAGLEQVYGCQEWEMKECVMFRQKGRPVERAGKPVVGIEAAAAGAACSCSEWWWWWAQSYTRLQVFLPKQSINQHWAVVVTNGEPCLSLLPISNVLLMYGQQKQRCHSRETGMLWLCHERNTLQTSIQYSSQKETTLLNIKNVVDIGLVSILDCCTFLLMSMWLYVLAMTVLLDEDYLRLLLDWGFNCLLYRVVCLSESQPHTITISQAEPSRCACFATGWTSNARTADIKLPCWH